MEKITESLIEFLLLIAGICFVGASPSLLAEESSPFNYAEVGYSKLEGIGFEPKGYYFKGSVEITNGLYVFGETKQGEDEVHDFNNNAFDVDFDRTGYGVGYNFDFDSSYIWFASLSASTWEIGESDIDVDIFKIGLRKQLTENFEFNFNLSRNKFDLGTQNRYESGYQVGMLYNFTDLIALTASFEDVDPGEETSIGLRFHF